MLHSLRKNLLRCRRNEYITVTPYYPSMAVPSSLIRYFTSDADNPHSFTLSYLVNSCGLSPKSALSASKNVQLRSCEQPDSVLSTFQKFGFSASQISELIKKYPTVLKCNPEKTISPKVEFFRSKGASTSDLVTIFTFNPRILRMSLENQLVRTFNILADLAQSEYISIKVVTRNPWIMNASPESGLIPNANTLRENGVPASYILHLIRNYRQCILENPIKFGKIVEEVKELGFNPLKLKLALAIMVLTAVTKLKWDGRAEVYKRWGWSDRDIASAFKKHPLCMAYSEDKIMDGMDFYVNKLGLDSSFVVNRPTLLGYSLKKRLIPRGAVIQFLCSEGLVEMNSSITKVFEYTESRFLEKYVKCHEEAPLLSHLYNKKLLEALCRGERMS